MKLALLAALLLAACATTSTNPQQALQVSFGQACATYGAALAGATQANNAGKLSKAQVQAVSAIDARIYPICSGPTPTDLNAATAQVTAAITQLATEAAIKESTK